MKNLFLAIMIITSVSFAMRETGPPVLAEENGRTKEEILQENKQLKEQIEKLLAWQELQELKQKRGFSYPDLIWVAQEVGAATGTLSLADPNPARHGRFYDTSAIIIDKQGYVLAPGHYPEDIRDWVSYDAAVNDIKFLWAPHEHKPRVAIPVKLIAMSPSTRYDLALFKFNPEEFLFLTGEKEIKVVSFGNADKIVTIDSAVDVVNFYGRYGGVVSSPTGLYFSLKPAVVAYPQRSPEFLRERYNSRAAPYDVKYLIELSSDMGLGSSGGLFFIGNQCFGTISRVHKLEKHTFVIPSNDIIRWLHQIDKELGLNLQLNFEESIQLK